ncbi:Aldehyde dehydrogenase [Haplosporangium sp. Z 27]|nr:Aldehyde dehydrogenase [Haplosporangium sp. Z 27]
MSNVDRKSTKDIPVLEFTPLNEIPTVIQEVRTTFNSGLTKSLSYRKEQLKGIHNMISENEDLIREAMFLDLGKPPQEVLLSEIGITKHECELAIKNLERWASPEKVKTPWINVLDDAHIRRDPLGVVLIIGAWNYSWNLLLIPAVGAIAAGNAVVFKPSEMAPHAAALFTRLLPKYLDQRSYRVVNGGVQETTSLLDIKFDHIFYTGSGNVGKIIMTAAAKQLTPVTLELGGKSPTFVSKCGNLYAVARRLVIGKFFNCGQTCIAPDYLIVERAVIGELVNEMKKVLLEFYGSSPQTSQSYARIVNKGHFQRIVKALKITQGEVIVGGDFQEDDLYIAPTLVLNVTANDPLMKDEIFGPVLPIMVVDSLEQGVDYVNSGDQPLALYIFSDNKKQINHILNSTRSGTAVVNDTLIQFAMPTLPFGGTGPSGIGAYHGKKSFDIFSHERSTIIKTLGGESLNGIRYPPYSEKKVGWLTWLLYSKVRYSPNAANPKAQL